MGDYGSDGMGWTLRVPNSPIIDSRVMDIMLGREVSIGREDPYPRPAQTGNPIEQAEANAERALEAARASLVVRQNEVDRASQRLERVRRLREALPEKDPGKDGDLLVFKLRFGSSDNIYDYAGLRVAGRYYLTGRNGCPKTWEQLREWWAPSLLSLTVVRAKTVVTGGKKIFEFE